MDLFRQWSRSMLDCVKLSVSILDSRTCTILLWSFLSVHSRYLLDYLSTVIDDATAVRSRYLPLGLPIHNGR